MAVKIRFRRIGRHFDAFYRIVAADSRYTRDGRYIEQIGYYDPKKGPESAVIDEELAIKWLELGAKPSDSVKTLFTKKGITKKFAESKKGKISMDYAKIIHSLVDDLIENKEMLMIRELPSESEKDVIILIVSDPKDTARLIGKKGSVANTLREIISVAGKKEQKRIHLKFESFEEDK